jgi:hypothetical protein
MKMSDQLAAYAVLHPVMQNRRLAGPTAGKDSLKKRKMFVPTGDRFPESHSPKNI